MSEIRLQKAIAQAGLMSRRAAEELIAEGRVTIDGVVAKLGNKVDPVEVVVAIDGVPIPVAPGLVSYLLYKPPGVISTADDPEGRQTVIDLVPEAPRVVPVGRLDADSEGLLLLSNDGELTLRVTHPRFEMEKTYQALVEGKPGKSTLRRLHDGVDLEDGPARVKKVRLISSSGDRSLLELVMTEGRNREVRRLLEAVGHPVQRLVRTAIGPLRDQSLKPGTWRLISAEETASLYRAAGRP